jgi:hypothetical protein
MEWISVKDKLPPLGHCVLVVNQFGEMDVAAPIELWASSPWEWRRDSNQCGKFYPTHWMPLPDPPKGSTESG